MKTLLVITALMLALVGCGEPAVESAAVSKVVKEKLASIEQRLSYDAFDKTAYRSRATPVYYLIAEDGTCAEVSLGEYARANVGKLATERWVSK